MGMVKGGRGEKKRQNSVIRYLPTVFLRGEKQKPLQIPWFLRGQVAKNTVNLQCFFNPNVKKHWYLRCFHLPP